MTNLPPVPEPRVSNTQTLQKALKWIKSFWFPTTINMHLLVGAETINTLVNKVSGVYSNPEEYLNSLVEYNKILNQGQGQKVAIVTGANSGIGYVTAEYLYKAGYYVILACRNEQKANEAIEKIEINKNQDGHLKFIKFDANSLQSANEFVKEFEKLDKKLDLLVNNAGIMMPPYAQTENFVESQIGTNFLSHYYLTDQLMSHLSSDAKIINLSSLASFFTNEFSLNQITNKDAYSPVGNYSQSKLAMTMFTYYLNSKLQSSDITVYSAHPGMVKTNLYTLDLGAKIANIVGKVTFKEVEAGTFTTLRCALLPPSKDHGKDSLYYADELPFYPPVSAVDETAVNELIDWAKETIRTNGFELKSDL
ncbi:NAD(P)-binding protein [Conidiobolus coronatus NRRL 28638]|uniref:NAD(P)-binding protein n=1 Tax=Conidiobolus coronatus (strain ATCC 28846 / CBS 209.66 / NRRL 28638) TaxID=796925 RepID=A0A137P8D0_CONC2|nr:NAD(P)-binding protein [Conidiobolus coronatus NRRL 28638]|eukprot:KXN71267.1 NAD(P)-binding protein [Conidiobolus coronatus NRRL 28638]